MGEDKVDEISEVESGKEEGGIEEKGNSVS